MHKIKILTFTAFIFLILPLLNSANSSTRPGFTDTDLQTQHGYIRDSDPRMDYSIYRLLQIYKTEGPESAGLYAVERDFYAGEGLVNISLTIDSDERALSLEGNRMRVIKLIEDIGGKSGLAFKSGLNAQIPAGEIEKLFTAPEVRYIGRIAKPITEEVISEGVPIIGANSWQNLSPYKTQGSPVKVAIIDVGFTGYKALLGTELPSQVTTFTTHSQGRLDTSEHGTGCAEVVHDIAPDAELYLMSISEGGIWALAQAVEYCINNGINVISTSLGWHGVAPNDGTGPLCDIHRWAYDYGIIWATAAGNSQRRHWMAYPSDPDGDGWLNFTDTDEMFEFDGLGDRPYWACITWDDWGTYNQSTYLYSGTDQDFDLYLYYWDGSEWVEIDKSENIQDGDDNPVEEVYANVPQDGRYGIAVKIVRNTKNVRFHLHTPISDSAGGMRNREYYVSDESIANGADCRHSISVAAFNSYDLQLAYYSSCGPTLDGRIKPDIAAPTAVSCIAYGNYGFTGTSAATPHVAGAIALMLTRLPFSTFEDITRILYDRAIDQDEEGKDNKWGAGRLYMR